MINFTDLLNLGKKKFIDKHLKKRVFGKCETCDRFDLLIEYTDFANEKMYLCNSCYNVIMVIF